jgi:hypothetical protein
MAERTGRTRRRVLGTSLIFAALLLVASGAGATGNGRVVPGVGPSQLVAGGGVSRPAVGAPAQDLISPSSGACQASQRTIHVGPNTICSHGPDPAPSAGQMKAANGAAAAASYPNAPCAKDAGGYVDTYQRIRVMYGYPSDTSYNANHAAQIANWLGIADYYLARRGGSQHYRFFCGVNSSGYAFVRIRIVKLLPIGSDGAYTYSDLVNSLYYQTAYGLGSTNYRNGYHDYAVFVDNLGTSYPYGGQSNVYHDSRWSPTQNQNNSTAYLKYSLINLYAGDDYTAQSFMHETGHSLGAVQDDAPHSSKAFHCYDEYDTMCYNDGGPYFVNGGKITFPSPCTQGVPYEVQYFDCQRNDYYNAKPTSGTYIYNHWNLANSYWFTPIQ